MKRSPKDPGAMADYGRSYIITLGLAFVAFAVFVWVRDGAAVATWPWWAFGLLAGFVLGGVCLVLFGLLGPANRMEHWAEVLARHDASIVVIVLAFPVYFLLFHGRR
jgi:hypothetical protein